MATRFATTESGAASHLMAEIAHTAGADCAARVLLTLNEILTRNHPDLPFHGREVSRYCALTGRNLGIPESRLERLELAGNLHDIGKIGISHQVLRKPGALSAEEWRHVKAHPEIGAQRAPGRPRTARTRRHTARPGRRCPPRPRWHPPRPGWHPPRPG